MAKTQIKKRVEQIKEKPLAPAEPKVVQVGEQEVTLTGNLPTYTPPGYQPAPDSIEQAPNYDKLGRAERWLLDKLPGFSESTVGQALQKFNESWAGKALQYLDVGAEALERGTGLAAQYLAAIGTPESMQEFRESLGAAWYAGSLAADMANLPRYNRETGRLEFPTDLPGIEGLVQARQRIADLTAQGMDPGEALVQVRDQYYNDLGALAIRTQLHDAFFHIAGDPLNILLPYLKPVERTQTFRNTLRSRVIPETAQEIAQGTRLIDDGIRGLETALDTANDMDNVDLATQITSKLDDMRVLRTEMADDLAFALENQLTPFEEKFVRVFNLLPDEAHPLAEAESKIGKLAYKLNPFALTKGSRAHELMDTVLQRIQTALFQGGDPESWVRAINRSAEGMRSPELAQALMTIEGRAVRSALERSSAEATTLLNTFRRTEEFEGPLLRNMARVLETTPAKIIRRLDDGEDVAVAAQYLEKIASNPELAERMAFVFSTKGLQLNEAGMASAVERLGVFKDFVAWDDTMFQFELANKLIDGIQEMAIARFGLEARGTIYQVADAMKAAESLAFLKMNPAYPIKNWLNNFFTTIARGTYGNPLQNMEDFFKLHNIPEPPRLRSGVGMSGEFAQLTQQEQKIAGAALERGAAMLREIEAPKTGRLGKITRFFNERRGLGFGALAQRFERQASIRAYTAGYQKYFRQIHKAGKGFQRVHDELRAVIGDDVARTLEKQIESTWSLVELDEAVFAENLNLNMASVLEEASRESGMDISRILNDDFTAHIETQLVEAMKEGESAIRSEMKRIRTLVNQQIESHVDDVNYTILNQTAALVNAEGPGALPHVFSGMMDDLYGVQTRHATEMAKIGDELFDLPPNARSAFWDNLFADNEAFYTRQWGRMRNYIDGATKGLDDAIEHMRAGGTLTDDLERGLRNIQTELTGTYENWSGGWREFFERRMELFKELRRYTNKDNYFDKLDDIQLELDRRYNDLIGLEDEYLSRMDEIVSRGLPDAQRRMFLNNRKKINSMRRALREYVQEFRGDVRNLPGPERSKMWEQEFWPEYARMSKELQQAERANKAALMGNREAQIAMGMTERQAAEMFYDIRHARTSDDMMDALRKRGLRIEWGEASDYNADTKLITINRRYQGQAATDEFRGEVLAEFSHALEDDVPEITDDLRRIVGEPPTAEPGLEALERRLGGEALTPEEAALADELVRGRASEEQVAELDRIEQDLKLLTGEETIELDDLASIPRDELPEPISEQMEWIAKEMLDDIERNEPGGRLIPDLDRVGKFIGRMGSQRPPWYNEFLQRYNTSRKWVVKALEKIIKDRGLDKGVMVERLKNLGLDELIEGARGNPPDPSLLRAIGASEDEVRAALAQWEALGYDPTDQIQLAAAARRSVVDEDVLTRAYQGIEEQAARTYYGETIDGVVTEYFQRPDQFKAGEFTGGPLTAEGSYLSRYTPEEQQALYEWFEEFLRNDPDTADELYAIANATKLAAQESDAVYPAMADFHAIVPEELLFGKGLDELWFTRSGQALDAIEEGAVRTASKRPLKLDISPENEAALRSYISQVRNDMSGNMYAASRMGEWHRDTALLNYNRRMNYNNWLGTVVPYEFWVTGTAFRWALHSIDRPGMLTNFLRIKKFLNTAYRPETGFPSRLKGSIRVNNPFMPEWMGDDVFIDPMRTALPFDQFAYPFEEYASQHKRDEGQAERVLEELFNENKITQDEYQRALSQRSGPVWERALTLARQDDTEGRLNGFDVVSLLLAPHAPIQWAYNVAREQPENIQPFLPLTRSIKGVTALLGISPSTGGVNPEGALRKALGLPAFDRWDDYRVDRMLSNMAGTGEYSVNEVMTAMINREGPVYREAVRRAGIEFGWGAMGSITGIPTKAYPVGEENLRELRDDYEQAWTTYENGDPNAVSRFYEEHPEYETRLALWREPEERLRSFLVDNIWDTWHDMPQLHQDEVKNHLGDLFQRAFLDRDTRAYDAIPLDEMQYWLKVMGGDPPGQVTFGEGRTPLELTDPDTAYRLQAFYDTRSQMFRYSDVVWELQSDYFKLDEGSARRTFLREHPVLEQYWNWRRDFMVRNPDLAPYIEDNPEKLPTYPSEQVLDLARAAQPNLTYDEWQQVMWNNGGVSLLNLVGDYLRLGEPMPTAAQKKLDNIGEQMGLSGQEVLDRIELSSGLTQQPVTP